MFGGTMDMETKPLLESLKVLSYNERDSLLETCQVDVLETLAVKLYEVYEGKGVLDLLEAVLSERCKKLDAVFEWTAESRKTLLEINQKFAEVWEAAYAEALDIAARLENRIAANDSFVKDYEIKVSVTPYLGDDFYDDEVNGTLGYVLSEPKSFSVLDYSFGHNSFKHHEKPIYLDRSLNWNLEYFRSNFKDDYIGYAIHELLDTQAWSFKDIISIRKLWADVEVVHQHFIEGIGL
jgi:hypothetical protein